MSRVAAIIGVVLILFGVLVALQGLNVLHGSIMSGQVRWTGWGMIAIAVGAACLVWSNQRKRPRP